MDIKFRSMYEIHYTTHMCFLPKTKIIPNKNTGNFFSTLFTFAFFLLFGVQFERRTFAIDEYKVKSANLKSILKNKQNEVSTRIS